MGGAILPDLPVDELGDWAPTAARAGVETILLAAPTTPDDRLALICERSHGWVYGVGVLGVTGERDSLASTASVIAKRLKARHRQARARRHRRVHPGAGGRGV